MGTKGFKNGFQKGFFGFQILVGFPGETAVPENPTMAKKKRHKQTKQTWPYKLTLSPCGTRWIKKYKGKQQYHPIPEDIRGNQKRLEAHNRKAWKEWWLPLVGSLKAKEAESEREVIRDRWNEHMERLSGRLYVAKGIGSREMLLDELLLIYIDEYEIQTGKPLSREERKAIFDSPQDHLEVFGFVPRDDRPEIYTLPDKRRLQADSVDSETTIEALIVRFLEEKKPEVAPRRITLIRSALAYMQQFVGGNTEFSEFSEKTLRDFKAHVMQLMKAGSFKDERAKTIMDVAKQFTRWCMAQSSLVSLIDPVVASSIHNLLNSRGALGVKTTRKAVKTSKIEEIRAFLTNEQITELVELYTLLAANCSLTPVDIVDVRWDDIADGVLTYKRHKERDKDNVPTVKYPLWVRTQELIAKMPKTDDRVIPKAAGTIDETFRYWKQATGSSISLGSIKKTSATLLSNRFDVDLADYWLGHSPNSIGTRHYIAPSDEKLALAVRWLQFEYYPPTKEALQRLSPIGKDELIKLAKTVQASE